MAAVNNYTHTTSGTTTVSGVAGLAGIIINSTSTTNTITVSDGGSKTIAIQGMASSVPTPVTVPYNVALTSSSVVVTMAATGDITILTW